MGMVTEPVVDGVEFLPARERWDRTSFAGGTSWRATEA